MYCTGLAEGLTLRLESSAFLNDNRMVETSRVITLKNDVLYYTQNMYTTAVAQPAQHIDATLHRTT